MLLRNKSNKYCKWDKIQCKKMEETTFPTSRTKIAMKTHLKSPKSLIKIEINAYAWKVRKKKLLAGKKN